VSCFKCLEELLKYLLLGFLTGDYLGMFRSGVDSFDVVVVKVAVAISVHNGKSLGYDRLASGVHGATNGTEELVVFNKTISVDVEVAEQLGDLSLGETESEVRHSFAELILVERH